jgi:hypothetical protein
MRATKDRRPRGVVAAAFLVAGLAMATAAASTATRGASAACPGLLGSPSCTLNLSHTLTGKDGSCTTTIVGSYCPFTHSCSLGVVGLPPLRASGDCLTFSGADRAMDACENPPLLAAEGHDRATNPVVNVFLGGCRTFAVGGSASSLQGSSPTASNHLHGWVTSAGGTLITNTGNGPF